MAVEIERKFLVTGDGWRDGKPGIRMAQGYLSLDPDRTVRVRVAGDQAWLTVKGKSAGISRAEFEYEIPPSDARELLAMCLSGVIEKTRYRVPVGSGIWDVDVFHGANEGLVLAEIELEHELHRVELPFWVGDEVSGDSRYLNACLAMHPFKDWKRL